MAKDYKRLNTDKIFSARNEGKIIIKKSLPL